MKKPLFQHEDTSNMEKEIGNEMKTHGQLKEMGGEVC